MRVTVDLNVCNGHGQCVIVAPEVFDLPDDFETVRLIMAEPGEESRGRVEEAAALCAVSAILVRA